MGRPRSLALLRTKVAAAAEREQQQHSGDNTGLIGAHVHDACCSDDEDDDAAGGGQGPWHQGIGLLLLHAPASAKSRMHALAHQQLAGFPRCSPSAALRLCILCRQLSLLSLTAWCPA